MKKNKRFWIPGICVLAVLVVVAGMAIFGLSSTVAEIGEEVISETPEAVLAKAGVEDLSEVSLPIAYFDQKEDACVNLYEESLRGALAQRQFEWTSCGYDKQEIEKGMVDYYLGDDYLPVAIGGWLTSNKGLSNMSRWFKAVEGKSKNVPGYLKLKYIAKEMAFSYENDEFYPIDDVEFSNGDNMNKDGHNHLFTMNFAVPIKIQNNGKERVMVAADDDTFIFFNNTLVADMGGIHAETVAEIWINEMGEVYASVDGEELAFSGVKVSAEDDALIRVFHADRDARNSTFKIKLSGLEPKVMDTKIADEGGVQVAYDPNDPLHAQPLGVSTNVAPEMRDKYVVIATVYGFLIVVVAIGIADLAHYLLKR